MFLNADTPEALRDAVAVATADQSSAIDAEVTAIAEAHAFCVRSGSTNSWLAAPDPTDPDGVRYLDPYFADAVRLAARYDGLGGDPEPGRGIVVLANDTREEGRVWRYVSDVGTHMTVAVDADACHRCSLNRQMMGLSALAPLGAILHVHRGAFAVEFVLCEDCLKHVEGLAAKVGGHRG